MHLSRRFTFEAAHSIVPGALAHAPRQRLSLNDRRGTARRHRNG
jgi:hypothetical protein